MIRQYYKKKFCTPITWLAILILSFRFMLLMDQTNLEIESSMELYQAICSSDGMAFFFFPALSFYCIFGISFFQNPEIIYRFTSIKTIWRKIQEVLFLDSLLFILLFHGMTFLTYLVLGQAENYFSILLPSLSAFFMQFVTSCVFVLLFIVLALAFHNTTFGFLISYSVVIVERISLQARGDIPFYFLGGMNLQSIYFFEGKWQFILCSILATGIILSFCGPWLLKKQDYLPIKGGKK